MLHRSLLPSALICSLLLILGGRAAEGEFQILPEKSCCLALPVREVDEAAFTKDTRTVSADVFLDRKTNRVICVGKEGKALAIVPARKEGFGPEGKAPQFLHRLVLPVRKWDEKTFDARTSKISVEVYHDERMDAWIYASLPGVLAVVPAGKLVAEKPVPEAKWLDRLPLKVRPSREFEPKPYLCSVEVYQDERTGVFLYAAESGALAVLPAAKVEVRQNADALAWSHALDLRARRPAEDEF